MEQITATHTVRIYEQAELAQLLGLGDGEAVTAVRLDLSRGPDDGTRVVVETRTPVLAPALPERV